MSEEHFSPKPVRVESLEDVRPITFEHAGKKYEVGPEAYNANGEDVPIVFPDNTVFVPGSWFGRTPADFEERLDLFKGGSPEETAQLLHGVVAKEVG